MPATFPVDANDFARSICLEIVGCETTDWGTEKPELLGCAAAVWVGFAIPRPGRSFGRNAIREPSMEVAVKSRPFCFSCSALNQGHLRPIASSSSEMTRSGSVDLSCLIRWAVNSGK